MNNQPYQGHYTNGQQGQSYYGNPGQPVAQQEHHQNRQAYHQHGVQTFQHNGYMQQPQQPHQQNYPPTQAYQYQQSLQNNNNYQFNPNTPQDIAYRQMPAPQPVALPRLYPYDTMQQNRPSPNPRVQAHHSQLPQMQTSQPTQGPRTHAYQTQSPQIHAPVPVQQRFSSPQYPSPLQQQLHSPHQQPHPSSLQQQIPLPLQRHQSSPHTQTQNAPAPQQQYQAQQRPHIHPATYNAPARPQLQPQLQPQPQKPSPQSSNNGQHKQAQAHLQQRHSKPSPKQPPKQPPKPSPKPMAQPLVPVAKVPKPLQQPKQPANAIKDRPPSAHEQKVSTTTMSPPTSQAAAAPSTDLMVALAEEYFGAAAKLKQESGKDHPTDEYYQLLAAGLRSLKVILANMRVQPPIEAAVRLRYASVLYDETEEFMNIEETLTNGITLCERNRLANMRYHMIHLLVRCMFRTKPKAALKSLDTAIRDVETTRHTPWVYAFRLLRSTLSMQLRQQQEVFNAVTQLKIISDKAAERGDRVVSALAAIMEAHIQISRSNTRDSIEQAQRALATVRSLQQTPDAKMIPQLTLMAGFIDVVCSLYQADTLQATSKMKTLQADMDDLLDDPIWSENGHFRIPLRGEGDSQPLALQDSGVLYKSADGGLSLCVNWLDKEQIYGIGYMLNALTRHHKNASDDHNAAEKLLKESQGMFDASDAREPSEQSTYARRALHTLLLVNTIFEQCSRNRWSSAKTLITQLHQMIASLPEMPGAPWQALYYYLDGVTQQATGNMEDALKAYHHESLALAQGSEYRSPYQRELALLATMNSLLIIRTPGHPLHSTYSSTLSALEPLAQASTSKNIFSANNLVRAAMPDLQATSSILDTKGFLQTALGAAKQTGNNQLMCITLNILSYKFFRGVVGEQAEKSGRATQTLATKGKDSLWLSVANGALAETLEAQGKVTEARATMKMAVDLAARLPKNMKGVVEGHEKGDGFEGLDGDGDVGMGLTDQFAM